MVFQEHKATYAEYMCTDGIALARVWEYNRFRKTEQSEYMRACVCVNQLWASPHQDPAKSDLCGIW